MDSSIWNSTAVDPLPIETASSSSTTMIFTSNDGDDGDGGDSSFNIMDPTSYSTLEYIITGGIGLVIIIISILLIIYCYRCCKRRYYNKAMERATTEMIQAQQTFSSAQKQNFNDKKKQKQQHIVPDSIAKHRQLDSYDADAGTMAPSTYKNDFDLI